MTILVTGCAGFIGSNFVHTWLASSNERVINLDKLTYAGNLANLDDLKDDKRHVVGHGDIGDRELVAELLTKYQPRAVLNFAAESHVDRSIHGPGEFIETNIVGTYHLLESVRSYWNDLDEAPKKAFRFLHVSTDEVYGSIPEGSWDEECPLLPNSPYSASKASSDLLVRSYARTHKLNAVTTRCSNNYGPYQYPEKVIPLFITNLMEGKKVPLYGDGLNVRDWLHVDDHCRGVSKVE